LRACALVPDGGRTIRRSNAGGGQFERLDANPGAATALMHMISQIDVSDIVPAIRVPTLVIHRTGDALIKVKAGRFRAKHILGARYLELPGADHVFWVGDNAGEIADAMQELLTGSRAPVPVDRVSPRFCLLTLLARPRKLPRLATAAGATSSTNITPRSAAILLAFVAMRSRRPAMEFSPPLTVSARRALRLRRWRRNQAAWHRSPCRAAHWRVRMIGDDVSGIAVHIVARVAAFAGAGEVLVSSTVKDLVAAPGCVLATAATSPSGVSPANGASSRLSDEVGNRPDFVALPVST
jgi:hypothetical protein